MFVPDPYAQPNPRKRIWWILLLILLIGGGLGAKPGYGYFKKWRSRQLITQAEQLMNQGKWQEAIPKAQVAFQLNQNNPRTVRAMARLLTRAGKDQGLLYWQLLGSRFGLSSEDKKQLIALALVHKRYDLARQPLDEALKEQPVESDILRLAAEFCQNTGESARALAFAKLALEREPDNKQLELFMARLLLASRNDRDASAGRDLLWRLGDGKDDPVALEALTSLAQSADLTASEIKELLKKLETRPGRGVREDFVAADLQLRLYPEKRSLFIAQMINQYQKGSLEGQSALGRWLNSKGERKKVLEVIPLENALKERELLLIYLDSLAGLNRWAEVDKILTGEKPPLEPILLELFRARAARQLGQDTAAKLYWTHVMEIAGQQPQWLSYVADYSEKSGELEQAERAYRKLAELPRSAKPGFAGLIRLAERKGQTRDLRNVMREMTAQFPDDPAPANDLNYLNLLLNEEVVASEESSRKQLAKNPGSYAARSCLALALYRLNKFSDAEALYREIPLDWVNALPSWQAVYVAVLGSTGQKSTARALAAQIDLTRLKPEERELIRRYL